ncbi:MAG: Gfo/Idh/MocA family oxidoreductase [Gemmataceae bacterium]
MSRRQNRRQFLQTGVASAAAAGYWLTGGVIESFAQQDNPMNKLNIALIGAGGRAEGNRDGVRGENIVAICDVDDARAAGTFKQYPDAPKFKDYRQMLDKVRGIDAVVVSTPDHTHAHASITAMRMGKHCYCEKPLTHSVYEARMMRETAAKHKVATQMGNQGTSSSGLRQNVEIIRSGAIGDVREVHVWTNRPIWPQNIEQRPPAQPIPDGLDWNQWLGPAPERAYNRAYVPFAWRGWWDFGTGALGDMGCHTMNMPYMALNLGAPNTVEADLATPLNNETGPNGCTVTYEFPARGEMPACKLYWYERRQPPERLMMGQKPTGSGALLVGSKGTLLCTSDYGDNFKLLPEADFRDFRPPAPTLPRSPGHHAEWIRACKGGAAAMSNFDYAGPLTEMVLLGNVAMRAQRKITWDSARLTTDVPGAAQFIRREYRKGWEL